MITDTPSMRKPITNLTQSQVVKELREKNGWTQTTLSELTGIAVSKISNIENGKSRLEEDKASLIATAFGVKPEFILFPNRCEKQEKK